MIAPNDKQWRTIWLTLGAAFVFWLMGQNADYKTDERFWNGVAFFAVVAGLLRVWMLEGAKTKPRDRGGPSAA